MTIIEIIGLISSVLSIGCAVYSGFSVIRNRRISSEISIKKDVFNYSELQVSMNEVIKSAKSIGIVNTVIRGYSIPNIIEVLTTYYECLSKNEQKLKADGIKESELDINYFQAKISLICGQGNNIATQKQILKEIYYKVVQQKSILLQLIDKKVNK